MIRDWIDELGPEPPPDLPSRREQEMLDARLEEEAEQREKQQELFPLSEAEEKAKLAEQIRLARKLAATGGREIRPEDEARYPYQKGLAIQKLRYSHEAMIDTLIANPMISQGQLAALFGRTQAWVSLVMSSDAFKARLAERRGELVDPVIAMSLTEKFHSVTQRSLEVLAEKLAQPAKSVSDDLVIKTATMGAKALGLGGNAPPQAPALPANYLESLAGRLMGLQSRVRGEPARPVYDVTPARGEVAA